MKIIPVLDLKNGQIVRGIAGQRETYQPIVSQLTHTTHPLEVAKAFRDAFGLSLFYLADLDAISGDAPNQAIYDFLRSAGFELWIDAGVRNFACGQRLLEEGIERIIVGLETLSHPIELQALVDEFGPHRVLFSLDLKHGQPVMQKHSWQFLSPMQMVEEVWDCDCRSVIVLDLARVGRSKGTSTNDLCRRIRDTHPEMEIITGGGVRDKNDLLVLKNLGVDGVLVASALHDGRIGKDDWQDL